ncbi:MAG: hypothetical protein H6822_22175 [Planctomycetaceae bacterium]|nr:hypothetical protein [Planctomycetaceae bacterium]
MSSEIPKYIWDDVRAKLAEWSDDDLAKAIASDLFTEIYAKAFEEANRAYEEEKEHLSQLPHDELVDRAFKLIQTNHTFCAFVDRGGYSCVYFAEDTRNETTSNDNSSKE